MQALYGVAVQLCIKLRRPFRGHAGAWSRRTHQRGGRTQFPRRSRNGQARAGVEAGACDATRSALSKKAAARGRGRKASVYATQSVATQCLHSPGLGDPFTRSGLTQEVYPSPVAIFLGNPLTGWHHFTSNASQWNATQCGPSQSFLDLGNDCGMSQSFSPLPPLQSFLGSSDFTRPSAFGCKMLQATHGPKEAVRRRAGPRVNEQRMPSP